MLFPHAESDPLVPRRELDRMVPALEEAGVAVEALRTPGEAHAHELHAAAFEHGGVLRPPLG